MLNFRKLKQDFSSSMLKEGRELYDGQKVLSAKLLHLDNKTLRLTGKILGQFDNTYETEIEIDRQECEAIDSDCDCPYNYDCQHLAALLYYLEQNIDKILVDYSKENDVGEVADKGGLDDQDRQQLFQKFKDAETKVSAKQEELYQKQVLQEYVTAAELLGTSPFFRAHEKPDLDKAEFNLVFAPLQESKQIVEFQIALRLPFRSKPLHVPNVREFLEAIRYEESLSMGGRRYCFGLTSFGKEQVDMVRMVIERSRFLDNLANEKLQRIAQLDIETFGMILARSHELACERDMGAHFVSGDEELPMLSGLYENNLDTPIRFSPTPASFRFILEYIRPPTSKMLLRPVIVADQQIAEIEHVRLLECAKPGMVHRGSYFRFPQKLTRVHLRSLKSIRDMTIPEPLFGSFVENAIPQLSQCAEIANDQAIQSFITLPYVGPIDAICDLSYLNGELEATLHFKYNNIQIPASLSHLHYEQAASFVQKEGVLARNLVEERKIIEDLFQDFVFNPEQGVYVAKTEKKIVEFMTDVIPRNQARVIFNCPQNLLDQFIYDQTEFNLSLSHTDRIDVYEIDLKVNGSLRGIKMELLWDCLASKRAFVELDQTRGKSKKSADSSGKMAKILVLDLERMSGLVQVFDELGIVTLDDHKLERPLWSLANIDGSHFEGLPVKFSITNKLVEIRKQMLGEQALSYSPVPEQIKATLRSYQMEGTRWLERLRLMFLNGILADDMGLGKTLQAIVAITQAKKKGQVSLIVCPTSLLYNWKEEFHKFNPKLNTLVVDGIPGARKKLIDSMQSYDVIITSYTLLQKDIECYRSSTFTYAVLDEAQHIKNRGTRNAKSVKMIQADHRLILSGTPIENSLDELWSLFDFLMPGFLSSFDRFVEKYVRTSGKELTKNLEYLRKKVAPFILRRMKSDVLDDLPPVSELVYHCQLSNVQQELYRSYAQSARDELVKLVERDGFDRVQIHVLATLTRLKQICCHPAIFAKEKAELGDSAKYDMLLELLQTLVEGGHKTVIFSQYTRMLQIMRDDLEQRGIRFLYLDGSSKNRLETVKQFNEDGSISVFLVSLKAGGTGLNLVGADTVIHYDMWWNPAVENQATDRVHRMGQKQSVSVYKLITLGSIEEKIAEMQKRKKGLVKKVVSCDDEAISKLTWEDVLELLKT